MATTTDVRSDELTQEMIERARAELVETDGEPLETPWHRAEINLLIEQVRCHRRGRADYYVGGNMFVYFSQRHARTRAYRGPDFFFVKDVDGTREREYWWVFDEEGRYPDVIIELLSRSTAQEDRTTKKEIYRATFRTREYFCYDPEDRRLEGWRLAAGGEYQPITPDARGWLWSEELELWLGTWEGAYLEERACWLRFYDAQGQLVAIAAEIERLRADDATRRADDEHRRANDEHRRANDATRRADDERRRAEAVETELARLKALLAEKGIEPPTS